MSNTRQVVEAAERPHFPEGAALVTGGSGGIGRVICERLADHGADVVLTYRANRDAADAVLAEIERRGRRGLALPLDLTDAAAASACIDDAVAGFGRLHTVVSATGSDISPDFIGQTGLEEWHRTIDADLNGFFHLARAALPAMRGEGGALVALTSAGLVRHAQKDILSTAPKAAIEALIRGIAREEGRYGIRANAVAIGVVDAGLLHRLEQKLPPDFVEAMKRNTALRRFGTAREAADSVVFLASAASGFTTGVSLTVDGGYSV